MLCSCNALLPVRLNLAFLQGGDVSFALTYSEIRGSYCFSYIPALMQVFWHCGAKVQVTGHRSARSQVRLQVTGHRPGHRSGHRPQVRSQVRSQVTHKNNRTLDNTVLIDILSYKNKTSQGTSIIFFLFWTLPNPTHEKIYACWSRKEDFRYSVTKVGNEITKVRKITWVVRKNEGLLC